MNGAALAQSLNSRHAKKRFEMSTETLPPPDKGSESSGTPQVSELSRTRKGEIRYSAFAEVLNESPEERSSQSKEQLPTSALISQGRFRLEPRNAGSGVCKSLTQNGEPELSVLGFLRDYPRARSPGPEPKSRFSSLLHRSTSERNFLGSAGKKMNGVAVKRTCEGRRYGQLDLESFYDVPVEIKNVYVTPAGIDALDHSALGQDAVLWRENNASTYRINEVEGVDNKKKTKSNATYREGRASRRPEEVLRTSSKLNGAAHIEKDNDDSRHNNKAGIDNNTTDNAHRPPMPDDQEEKIEKRSVSPAPILPLQEASQSRLAIDFTSILQKHRDANMGIATPRKSKRTSFAVSARATPESKPTVRDWALSHALRRRSKSPIKQSPLRRSPNKEANLDDCTDDFQHGRPNAPMNHAMHDGDIQESQPVADVLTPENEPETETQRQSIASEALMGTPRSNGMRGSVPSNRHTKTPSLMSVDSIVDGTWSEVSSAIVSDAQSVLMSRPKRTDQNGWVASKPTKPGPAPNGPLPSLPEIRDAAVGAASMRDDASRPLSTPQRSPNKSRGKASHKYTLTPTNNSPPKAPLLPDQKNHHTRPDTAPGKPSVVMRVHNTKMGAFPSPPPSPDKTKLKRRAINSPLKPRMVSSDSEDPRSERTKSLKERDLARERSQKAVVLNDPPPPLPELSIINDVHHNAFGLNNTQPPRRQVPVNPGHRAQSSGTSHASTSLPEHDDQGTTSSRGLSQIIVVANQAPDFNTESPSHSSLDDEDGHAGAKTPPPQPLASPLAFSHELDSGDPISIAPIDVPAKSPYRLGPNRIPTPGLLKAASFRSSQRSSLAEPEFESRLEARMAAMEKKNVLLERAFLAVMDASASISSSGDGSRGRLSGYSMAGTDNLDGRNSYSNRGSGGGLEAYGGNQAYAEQLDKMAEGDRLYSELEKRLEQRGSSRLSTCSGP